MTEVVKVRHRAILSTALPHCGTQNSAPSGDSEAPSHLSNFPAAAQASRPTVVTSSVAGSTRLCTLKGERCEGVVQESTWEEG